MKIDLHELTVREIAAHYKDGAEEGVVGYGGKLNIRPKYQREFVYEEDKRTPLSRPSKRAFVSIARSTSTLKRLKPTTLRRGTRAAKQLTRIAKSCARNATAESRGSRGRSSI